MVDEYKADFIFASWRSAFREKEAPKQHAEDTDGSPGVWSDSMVKVPLLRQPPEGAPGGSEGSSALPRRGPAALTVQLHGAATRCSHTASDARASRLCTGATGFDHAGATRPGSPLAMGRTPTGGLRAARTTPPTPTATARAVRSCTPKASAPGSSPSHARTRISGSREPLRPSTGPSRLSAVSSMCPRWPAS